MNASQVAGLGLLNELRSDFGDVHTTLSKILANIVGAPDEPKFRRLKTTNARIAKLLDARGARQLLVGSGFVEEADALALPEGAAIEPVQASLAGLTAQQKARKEEEEKTKLAAVEEQRAAALRARRSKEPAATEAQTKASHILLKVSGALGLTLALALALTLTPTPTPTLIPTPTLALTCSPGERGHALRGHRDAAH